MIHKRIFILALSVLSIHFMVGCSGSRSIQVQGLTDVNATAIAFDAEGTVLDFVHIVPGSDIDWIEFHAPDNGEKLFVIAVGPNVHSSVQKWVVSTKMKEGFTGKVDVEVEDDVIVSIAGNRFSSKNPLTLKDYEGVRDQLNHEEGKHSERVTIIKINGYLRDLVKNPEGNLTPKEMTPAEETFLNKVIPALRKGNMDTLAHFIHKDPSDRLGINTVQEFLELVSSKNIGRFRFMKFDPNHPENHEQLGSYDGTPYRFSLPVEWVLTVYFTKSSIADFISHADLLVGADNGVLKFPTTYVD